MLRRHSRGAARVRAPRNGGEKLRAACARCTPTARPQVLQSIVGSNGGGGGGGAYGSAGGFPSPGMTASPGGGYSVGEGGLGGGYSDSAALAGARQPYRSKSSQKSRAGARG